MGTIKWYGCVWRVREKDKNKNKTPTTTIPTFIHALNEWLRCVDLFYSKKRSFLHNFKVYNDVVGERKGCWLPVESARCDLVGVRRITEVSASPWQSLLSRRKKGFSENVESSSIYRLATQQLDIFSLLFQMEISTLEFWRLLTFSFPFHSLSPHKNRLLDFCCFVPSRFLRNDDEEEISWESREPSQSSSLRSACLDFNGFCIY